MVHEKRLLYGSNHHRRNCGCKSHLVLKKEQRSALPSVTSRPWPRGVYESAGIERGHDLVGPVSWI